MNELISMYIDDELSLDDKIEFVEQVHEDRLFKDESIQLLRQEKWIRSEVVRRVPDIIIRNPRQRRQQVVKYLAPIGAVLAAAVLILVLTLSFSRQEPPLTSSSSPGPSQLHRFVLYMPDASQTEITGSFTSWDRLTMERVGETGYWVISLPVSSEEHRYSFIVDNHLRLADPTILERERDDFGGENSILYPGAVS